MKTIATGRVAQTVAKYGEHAPTAAVCCNACRACVTTNIVALATATVGAAGVAIVGFVRRVTGAAAKTP